jgi:hypothetical protein
MEMGIKGINEIVIPAPFSLLPVRGNLGKKPRFAREF